MNRNFYYLATLLIIVSVITGLTCGKAIGQNATDKPVSVTMQADIYKIISGSCIDCHAKGGKKMAMSHIYFSEWYNYPFDISPS
jgi:hypothetical protein